jgi:hypothetical protein
VHADARSRAVALKGRPEYDTVSDLYARFLMEEVLPEREFRLSTVTAAGILLAKLPIIRVNDRNPAANAAVGMRDRIKHFATDQYPSRLLATGIRTGS